MAGLQGDGALRVHESADIVGNRPTLLTSFETYLWFLNHILCQACASQLATAVACAEKSCKVFVGAIIALKAVRGNAQGHRHSRNRTRFRTAWARSF